MLKSFTISIKSYTIEIEQHGADGTATINLLGNSHFSEKVALRFHPVNPYEGRAGPDTIGIVANLGSTTTAVTANGWFDRSAFAGFYQVLSSETPVSLKISYHQDFLSTPPDAHFVDAISLLTGSEKPGDFEKS